jgi:hypothetical protein
MLQCGLRPRAARPHTQEQGGKDVAKGESQHGSLQRTTGVWVAAKGNLKLMATQGLREKNKPVCAAKGHFHVPHFTCAVQHSWSACAHED